MFQEDYKLTKSDEELLGQLVRFVERVNGPDQIYFHRGHSRSLGQPTLILCAIGEQALMLDQVLLGDKKPTVSSIIVPDQNNGTF